MWVAITRELVDRIVRGDYPIDSTVPTEGELGRDFGVSRTVIRESIKVLSQMGLVRIDRGRGTMVRPRDEWRSFDPVVLSSRLRHGDRRAVLRELFVIRKGIEPELAAIVAASADDVGLARLGARVSALVESVADPDAYLISDGAFHDSIAEIAGVSLASEILRTMAEPLALGRHLTNHIPGAIESAHAHHLEVFRAILDRDTVMARLAMRRHIEWAEEHVDEAL